MPETTTEAMIDRDKYDYKSLRIVDPDTGKTRTTTGNLDAVARALLLVKFDALLAITKKNGLGDQGTKTFDGFNEGRLNRGQVRMNIGNSLRAKVKKGEPVEIGSVTVKRLDQRDPIIKEAPPAERKLTGAAAKAKAGAKTRAKQVA